MARLKKDRVTPGVREYLLERYRPLSERFASDRGCPWHRLVERLESGEPVIVPGSSLRRVVPHVDRGRRYEVRSDDSMHLVDDVEPINYDELVVAAGDGPELVEPV